MRTSSPWLRRLPAVLVALGAMAWTGYQLFGPAGLSRLVHLHRELATVRAENATLYKQYQRLQAERALLDDDNRAIERLARDDLGLVRKGEIVFRVEAEAR